jgi:Cof subfamily protein (haloacid dehalogenase superfamily)
MKKAIFIDLDGTLLDGSKKISPYTHGILKSIAMAGHHIIPCSGRDIKSVTHVCNEIGLDFPGMYLIGYNGGQIFDCDRQEIIHRVTMKKEQALQILATATEMGIYSHTYSDTHIIAPRLTDELIRYSIGVNTPYIVSDDLAATLTYEPNKCLAIDFKSRDALILLRERLEALLPEVLYAYSTPYFLDMLPPGSGKGAALIKLCEILGISANDAIAAGDEENDLSMLEAAGTAIAMCSGADVVKNVADIITDHDNNHDGLARVLAGMLSP